MDEASRIAAGLSANARATINDGDDHEWYAVSDRAAEQLERCGIVRRPFNHDSRICAPNELGLAVRQHLMEAGK